MTDHAPSQVESAEPREPVLIARCPIHGLHGERDTCFVCDGQVEQVAMVPAPEPLVSEPPHSGERWTIYVCATCGCLVSSKEWVRCESNQRHYGKRFDRTPIEVRPASDFDTLQAQVAEFKRAATSNSVFDAITELADVRIALARSASALEAAQAEIERLQAARDECERQYQSRTDEVITAEAEIEHLRELLKSKEKA